MIFYFELGHFEFIDELNQAWFFVAEFDKFVDWQVTDVADLRVGIVWHNWFSLIVEWCVNVEAASLSKISEPEVSCLFAADSYLDIAFHDDHNVAAV